MFSRCNTLGKMPQEGKGRQKGKGNQRWWRWSWAWWPRGLRDTASLCVFFGPDTRSVQAPFPTVLSYIEMLMFHNPHLRQACQEQPQANTEKRIKGHWWRLFLLFTSQRFGGVWVAHQYHVRFWQSWFIFTHLCQPFSLLVGDCLGGFWVWSCRRGLKPLWRRK